LLGSHIIPIEGKDTIYDEVTRYRDATQYLWDQSIRLINKGYTPVELQHALKDLPDHLNQPPYSVPTYGTPFTTVPEFFTGWVSWFDGDATNLLPTEPKIRATRFVELMGGGDAVLEAAKLAQADGDHQFAAELAQLVVRADPDNEDAKLVKAAALRARGHQELNPIARSWYLTGALELEGAFDPAVVLQEGMKNFESSATVRDTAKNWRYLLDAEAAGETRLVIGIRATDSGDELTVTLRNSVLSTEDGISADADAVVELVTADIVGRPNVSAVKTVDGDADAFGRLVAFLDTEPTIFYMHQR
jgi:alkyl sulfatase BDS1-like metallo-beta-lactamase superfamily hydrolase